MNLAKNADELIKEADEFKSRTNELTPFPF